MARRIFIVDDDAEYCEELAEVLTAEGYAVESATDPFDAVTLIGERPHDLYILDYKLPGLSGADLLKKIKDLYPSARAMIITGKPFAGLIAGRIEDAPGADEILKKPVEMELLIKKIRALLSAAGVFGGTPQ